MEPIEYEAMATSEREHWWYHLLHQEVIHWIEKRRPSTSIFSILDAGCGTGGLYRKLRQRYPEARLAGLERSDHALPFLPKQQAIVQGSILQLPFKDESFDLVTSLDVLYIRGVYEQVDLALQECCRVLRPGGSLILQLPALQWLFSQHDTNVHGAHRFNKADIRKLLPANGFEAVSVYYRFPALVIPAKVMREKASEQAGETHVVSPPGPLNMLLKSVFTAESILARHLPFPVGTSLFTVAAKC